MSNNVNNYFFNFNKVKDTLLLRNKNYNKVLIFQYGKVGSTSIRGSDSSGKYYPTISETYNEKFIQVHSHEVAKDVLRKYKNILIINIVRLPIDRNISAFFESLQSHCENYKKLSLKEITEKYNQLYSVNHTDKWMSTFFDIFNININTFTFDKNNKYNKFTLSNGNEMLLFRYEDLEYITSNILPKYDINVKKKI